MCVCLCVLRFSWKFSLHLSWSTIGLPMHRSLKSPYRVSLHPSIPPTLSSSVYLMTPSSCPTHWQSHTRTPDPVTTQYPCLPTPAVVSVEVANKGLKSLSSRPHAISVRVIDLRTWTVIKHLGSYTHKQQRNRTPLWKAKHKVWAGGGVAGLVWFIVRWHLQ